MINDKIALMPIEEFFELNPSYWSTESDKYYQYSFTDESSKRNLRKKNKPKDGYIVLCKFGISRHSKRPGLVLEIPGMKPVICIVASIYDTNNWDSYSQNVKIKTPLKDGYLDHESYVATDKFRYLESNDIEIIHKIGEVQYSNLEKIKEVFRKININDDKLLNEKPTLESLLYENIESVIEDIKEDNI